MRTKVRIWQEETAESGAGNGDGKTAESGVGNGDGKTAESGAGNGDEKTAESGAGNGDGKNAESGAGNGDGKTAESAAGNGDGKNAENMTGDCTGIPEDKRIRVVYEMQGLAHSIKRYMDRLAEEKGLPRPKDGRGISGTNLFIMAYLYEHRDRDVFQKDLEEQLNVRRSTVSKVLQIMEAKELIRREQVARDGRLKKIVLTESSMERVGAWREHSRKLESRITRGFNEAEVEQFCRLLNKAKQNFRD